MSYFSEIEYKPKTENDSLWFERLYFNRWFKNSSGPILDIGCATGNFISVEPSIIEGIDIDDDCLRVAKKRGLNVRKVDLNKEMYILESDKYEGIYAKHVIEHLYEPLNFLKGIRRILKHSGRAIISTPNCPYMLDKGFWDDYTHIHPFTRRSLKMLAIDAGFDKIKIYEDFRCFPGLGRLMRLFNISPEDIRKIQQFFGFKGLSLILELTK